MTAISIKDKLKEGVTTDHAVNAPFPKEFQLDITDRCNHVCVFCSNPKLLDKKDIDPEFARRILREAYENGSRMVGIYGTGEPLMVKHLPEYVRYAKELGYEYIYIDTNGALATPKIIRPVIDAGLDSIKFSINAGLRETYEEIHGKDDLDLVLKNLACLADYKKENDLGVKIYVSMVVTDKVKDEVDILEKLVIDHVDDWYARPLFNTCGNNPENNELADIESLYIRGRKRSEICFQPFKGFCVTPEGYLSACILDYQRTLILANLNEVSLLEGWQGDVAKEFRNRHRKGDTKGWICYNCIHNTNEPFEALLPQYAAKFAD
jgi:MoaA/NifB/PqqE/SkfB family radical SAM enzyme